MSVGSAKRRVSGPLDRTAFKPRRMLSPAPHSSELTRLSLYRIGLAGTYAKYRIVPRSAIFNHDELSETVRAHRGDGIHELITRMWQRHGAPSREAIDVFLAAAGELDRCDPHASPAELGAVLAKPCSLAGAKDSSVIDLDEARGRLLEAWVQACAPRSAAGRIRDNLELAVAFVQRRLRQWAIAAMPRRAPRDGGGPLGASRGYRLWDPFGYLRLVLDRAIERHLASIGLSAGSRVLDLGCGTQPYRPLVPADCEYLGADIPGNPLADLPIVDGMVDLPDGSFDLVISTQVLEHVPDPQRYLTECRRVLCEGGSLLLSTHGTMFYHPVPEDLWRWTAEGLALTIGRSNLEVESITPVMGTVPTAIWLVMMNVQSRLPWGLRHAFVAMSSVAMRVTDRPGINRTYASDCVYVVLARRAPETAGADPVQ